VLSEGRQFEPAVEHKFLIFMMTKRNNNLYWRLVIRYCLRMRYGAPCNKEIVRQGWLLIGHDDNYCEKHLYSTHGKNILLPGPLNKTQLRKWQPQCLHSSEWQFSRIGFYEWEYCGTARFSFSHLLYQHV